MSPVSVNAQTWDDVEERTRGEFKAIPAGLYDECYLKDWEKRTSKKGDDYYSPEYVVTTGEGESHVWGYWSTAPKSRGFMKKDLAALGVDLSGVDVDDEDELEDRMEAAKNANCRLRVKIRTYKDEDDEGNEIMKESNEIVAVLPA